MTLYQVRRKGTCSVWLVIAERAKSAFETINHPAWTKETCEVKALMTFIRRQDPELVGHYEVMK